MQHLPRFCVMLAATTDAAEDPSPLFTILMSVFPWVLVLVFIWFFVLRHWKQVTKTQNRAMEQIERSFEHMERTEAQLDRMIALLEQLNDRLDRSE